MTAKQQAKFSKIYDITNFKVGDFVHHRFWTVPLYGPQTPIVVKKPMRVVEINGERIWCGGGKEFRAFELIPSEWKPK